MSYQVQFSGQGPLTEKANKLLPQVGMTLLARFDTNPAPMTQRLLDEVPLVARSSFDGQSLFHLEISGTTFLWATLAVSEFEGGFVFFGLPPRSRAVVEPTKRGTPQAGRRMDTSASIWTRELIDWLRENTTELGMASLGETEHADIANFARRAVPIPAMTMIKVLNGELS